MIKYFTFCISFIILICLIIYTGRYTHIFSSNSLLKNNVYTEGINISDNTKTEEVIVKKRDALKTILREQNLPDSDIRAIIKLALNQNIASQQKINQKLVFKYNIDPNNKKLTLDRMIFIKDKINSIEFIKQGDKFYTDNIMVPLKRLITQYNTTIDSSLIASLKKAGMNTNSIIRLINAYSHQIDFQRQIRAGDKITVIIEKFITDDNEFSHHGKILHANLNSQKIDYNIYRFSPTGKKEDLQFFSEDGQSIKSTLLKTPVKFARISSHYGYRKKHPVLGYGKMHKGVDFAASTGTPIYAAGNGTVFFIGWKSSYGRLVLIKHDKTLSTAYAHASKFAAGLRKGSRVKQGDVIAFIGQSGKATGPHLHYEVRINGQQVNPLKFKSKPEIQLTGAALSNFHHYQGKVLKLSQRLKHDIELQPEKIDEINLY